VTSYQLDVLLTESDLRRALQEDVRAGFGAPPGRRTLPPKWFYDERGSKLFDEITRLPEYYPTRCERAILGARAGRIMELVAPSTLIELGSGTSEKTRLLLDAGRETVRTFTPFDVSESTLRSAAEDLSRRYPRLAVHAVAGDFERHLGHLALLHSPGGPAGSGQSAARPPGPWLLAFLGSTIGNFEPQRRRAFLGAVAAALSPGDWLLLGTDLVKDPARLVAAYDDGAGVTAEFNRNVLAVVNRELGGDADLDRWAHVARWDADQEWIEMRLRAQGRQTVNLFDLAMTVRFEDGEEVRTEISAKFRRPGVSAELAAAGFELREWWTDPAGDFGLSLSQRR